MGDLDQEHSRLFAEVERFIVLSWSVLIMEVGFNVTLHRSLRFPTEASYFTQAKVTFAFADVLKTVAMYLYIGIVRKRIALTEKAFGKDLGLYKFSVLRHANLVVALGLCAAKLYACSSSLISEVREPKELEILSTFAAILTPLALGTFTFQSLASILRVTAHAAMHTSIFVQVEAAWSHRVFLKLRYSVLFPAFAALCLEIVSLTICLAGSFGFRTVSTP